MNSLKGNVNCDICNDADLNIQWDDIRHQRVFVAVQNIAWCISVYEWS